MKLIYLSTLSYPSRFANRLQVMKMSEAFSRLADFTLFVIDIKENLKDIFTSYHITHPFRVETIGKARIWPRSLWIARAYAKKINEAPGGTVFYVREIPLAFWLTLLSKKFRSRFFFEAQSLEKFHWFFYRVVFPRARGIITTTRKKADIVLHTNHIPASRTLVFGNAVDLDEFQNAEPIALRKNYTIPAHMPIIMYAGSLEPDYGIHTMIEAAHILQNEAMLVLIGKCGLRIPLPNVIRIEQMPRHEIPKYLLAADILIAPYSDKNYHIKYFSVPVKISEYMAAGKPIIISDMPSMREILDESLVTFMEPDNAQDLAEKIRWVITHPADAAAKVKNASEAAKQRTWNTRAETIVEFIAHLTNNI